MIVLALIVATGIIAKKGYERWLDAQVKDAVRRTDEEAAREAAKPKAVPAAVEATK